MISPLRTGECSIRLPSSHCNRTSVELCDGKTPLECGVRIPRPNSVVLVVEDDQQTREMYRAALMAAGFVVVAVEDGLDALRVLEQRRPSAVVLDLGLPRLAG